MIGDYQRGAVMKHTRRLLQRLRMIELFKVLGMTVHQVNRIRKKIVIISSSDYCWWEILLCFTWSSYFSRSYTAGKLSTCLSK
jgi:hypothetical protein